MLNFSIDLVILFVVGLVGALVHYLKVLAFEVNKTNLLGFYDWLIGASPIKSLSVVVLLAIGVVVFDFLGFFLAGVVSYVLVFLYGYFLDSILKRYPKVVAAVESVVNKV